VKPWIFALPLALLSTFAMADPLKVEDAVVPLSPPTAMAHAAYMKLLNASLSEVEVIGASAEGYAMAHLHVSEEKNGVATMSSVESIIIDPDQHVIFEPGGLHIMLMRPTVELEEGGTVEISLSFADGSTQAIKASVVSREALASFLHGHGS